MKLELSNRARYKKKFLACPIEAKLNFSQNRFTEHG